MYCCKCKEYEWKSPQLVEWIDPKTNHGYCQFHAPVEQKNISYKAFNEAVFSFLKEESSLNGGNQQLNLAGTIFPGNISFQNLKKNTPITINFKGCYFGGRVTFSKETIRNADFSNAEFVGAASFRECIFDGHANFAKSIFHSRCAFKGSKFLRGANFKKAKYLSPASFDHVEFRESAIFKQVEAISTFSFKHAFFEREGTFLNATLKGYTWFQNVTFKGVGTFRGTEISSIYFTDTTFYALATFTKSKISKAIITDCIFEKRATFKLAAARSIYFSNTIFFDESSFLLTSFHNAYFESVIFNASSNFSLADTTKGISFVSTDMYQCYFLRTDMSNIHLINSCWPRSNGRILMPSEDDPEKVQQTRDFYQRMKRKYKDEHNEYEASKWHVAEKEVQLKMLKKNGDSKFIWGMLWLYRFFSGFGENPLRAGIILASLIFLPLLTLTANEWSRHFEWWTIDPNQVNIVLKNWLKYLPLTKAAAYKDTPGGVHFLMFVWQSFITVQAALFAFALRNRFRR